MVNSSKEGTSFWAKHKSFVDNLFKAGAIVLALKLIKAACDKIDQ